MKSISLSEINDVLKGIIVGNSNLTLTAPEQIETAKENEITFIGHKKYEKLWQASNASVAVVN
ncbi:MAG: UDP-3-O-[3-hydroxymyristoyl] glucosamine N-acyltransferase, partial [Flavobacterium sp.]